MKSLIPFLALAAALMAATIIPLTGNKWKLYDLGGTDLCGINACTSTDKYPGNLADGSLYFNLPVALDQPYGGYVHDQTFTGTGLNDAVWPSGSATAATTYCTVITGTVTNPDGSLHDTYSVGTDPAATNLAAMRIIEYPYPSNGYGYNSFGTANDWVYLGFYSVTGHTIGDRSCATVSPGTTYKDWRGYLVTQPSQHKFTTAQTLNVTLQVVTTGAPVFGFHSASDNTGTIPANIRPYFQSGALWSTNSDGSNRWWSNPSSYTLAQGGTTLTIPLQPANWSDTYGKFGNADAKTTQEFTQTLGNVGWIGLTMGGGDFYGHGVNVSGGTAHVIIQSFSIQ